MFSSKLVLELNGGREGDFGWDFIKGTNPMRSNLANQVEVIIDLLIDFITPQNMKIEVSMVLCRSKLSFKGEVYLGWRIYALSTI